MRRNPRCGLWKTFEIGSGIEIDSEIGPDIDIEIGSEIDVGIEIEIGSEIGSEIEIEIEIELERRRPGIQDDICSQESKMISVARNPR